MRVFIVVFFMSFQILSAQTGSISFSTQEEIDNFDPSQLVNAPAYNLSISGESINDLSSLVNKLPYSYVNVSIHNTSLVNLQGLTNVRRAFGDTGGFNTGGSIYIADNSCLESFIGLPNSIVTQNVSILNNPKLKNGNLGLSNLLDGTWVSSQGFSYPVYPKVVIENNEELITLDNYGFWERGSSLVIRNNPKLEALNFDNLSSLCNSIGLYSLDGILIIENNDALKNLDGFQNFREVCGSISIRDNDSLRTINFNDTLRIKDYVIENNHSLESLGDYSVNFDGFWICTFCNPDFQADFIVSGNSKLTSISLKDVKFIQTSMFGINYRITNNAMLSTCSEDYLCRSIADIEKDTHIIVNNDDGCNDLGEVASKCCSDFDNPDLFEATLLNNDFCVQDYRLVINNCEPHDFGKLKFYILDNELVDYIDFMDVDGATISNDTLIWDLENANFNVRSLEISLKILRSFPVDKILQINSVLYNQDNLEIKSFNFNNTPAKKQTLNLCKQQEVDLCSCIKEINGYLTISDSNDITNLDSLKNVRSVGSSLQIENNEFLQSIDGLRSLEEVGYNVEIESNMELSTLDGLDNLRVIDNDLKIINNSKLSSISALNSILSLDELEISDNEILINCETDFVCSLFDQNEVEFIIHDNGPGCASEEEVDFRCIIKNDQEVKVEIQKLVCNSSIVDVVLRNYGDVAQNLNIKLYPVGTSQLSLFKYLAIDGATQYNDTLFWRNITSQSFSEEIFKSISVKLNADLQETDSLAFMVEIDVDDDFPQNNTFEFALCGFDNPVDIALNKQIAVDLCSCVTEIEGNLEIRKIWPIASDITNLDSLINLKRVLGRLSIYDNDILESLAGLNNLEYLGSSLSLRNCPSLTTIESFESLTRVGSLWVENNESLTRINGFQSLNWIASVFGLSDNNVLESIDAFENLEYVLNEMRIYRNPSLSFCSVSFICRALEEDLFDISFSENDMGCNSKSEVLEYCTSSMSLSENEVALSIFPNPSSDLIFIESEMPLDNYKISLKNLDGKTMTVLSKGSETIDVSSYPSGLYLLSIESEHKRLIKKIIVE